MAPKVIPAALSLLALFLAPAAVSAHNVTCNPFGWRYGPRPPLLDCQLAVADLEHEWRAAPQYNQDRVWGRDVHPIPLQAEKTPAAWINAEITTQTIVRSCEFYIDNVPGKEAEMEVFNFETLQTGLSAVIDQCLSKGLDGRVTFPDGNVYATPKFILPWKPGQAGGIGATNGHSGESFLTSATGQNFSRADGGAQTTSSPRVDGSVTPFRMAKRSWQA